MLKNLPKTQKSLYCLPDNLPLKKYVTYFLSYETYLIETLKDADEASAYLDAAIECGDIKVFVLALKNVIKANDLKIDIG